MGLWQARAAHNGLLFRVSGPGRPPFCFLFKGTGTVTGSCGEDTREHDIQKHAHHTPTNPIYFLPCPPHRLPLAPHLSNSALHVHQVPPRKTSLPLRPHVLAHEVVLDGLSCTPRPCDSHKGGLDRLHQAWPCRGWGHHRPHTPGSSGWLRSFRRLPIGPGE
jgi:hypothetical protein